jgi:hypothetical protein
LEDACGDDPGEAAEEDRRAFGREHERTLPVGARLALSGGLVHPGLRGEQIFRLEIGGGRECSGDEDSSDALDAHPRQAGRIRHTRYLDAYPRCQDDSARLRLVVSPLRRSPGLLLLMLLLLLILLLLLTRRRLCRRLRRRSPLEAIRSRGCHPGG